MRLAVLRQLVLAMAVGTCAALAVSWVAPGSGETERLALAALFGLAGHCAERALLAWRQRRVQRQQQSCTQQPSACAGVVMPDREACDSQERGDD